MKTIDPETVTEGMRLRITHTLRPDAPLIEGRIVYEGTVTAAYRPAGEPVPTSVALEGDNPVTVELKTNYADVTIETGEWPEGTIAYADIVFDGDPARDLDPERKDVLIRRDHFGWYELDNYRRHSDVDIDSGQVRLERLRVVHDGRVPQ